ncbi:MAG: helix-turn-helix domain-containing protein [Promethearchaeota archaeon]
MTEGQNIRDEHKALERLGLTAGEINAYFSVVGKGICLINEIAKHAGVELSEAKNIVAKLIEKGLFKEVPGRTVRFQAIPPYAALLNQLETFRDYVTELRDKVPQQLQEEFDRFEEGFSKVSGLQDFKKFVTDVKDDIPAQLTKKLTILAEKFQKFEQLEEFGKFINDMRNSVPSDLSYKFQSFRGQFEKLEGMEKFANFVSQIREKATKELTNRFSSLETEFTELKTLEDLKQKFSEIKTTVPEKLRGSFANFQEQFKTLAGLTGFKKFVGNIKRSLPQKISAEFQQIENQFTQLKKLQDFANFVRTITADVPKQMVDQFKGFEDRFRSVSGLEEFRDFITDLRKNIPHELEGQFQDFEKQIRGIKTEILNTETTLMSNYAKIMGDIFSDFINAFVSDVVMEQLEGLKGLFQERVIEGVQQILSKVLLKTQTMSQEVLDSFDQLRKWLMEKIISGLKNSLEAVNQKVIAASEGVSKGFNRLREWITTQVTSDLERTLTEVETGATDASQKVINAISTLQSWFDEKVVAGLSMILSNMETKLGEVAEKASESLKDVKSWFVKDAIQGIENTLAETQTVVGQVQIEVQNSLKMLEDWFKGEAINQLEESLQKVEGRVQGATQDVLKGFDEMKNWVSSDVIITIKETLDDVTKKVQAASTEIDKEVTKLKTMFQSRVVQNTFNMLSGIEDRLWESEATMKAFWDKALSEITFRFQEVWFVQGADAMVGEIAAIVDRVKSKLYICAPRLEDIDFTGIRTLPSKINVRIAANIDPESEEEMKILKEFIDKSNFTFRHYPDENIWGVSKDMEEIILGAVSGLDVAGIGSVIDEHIKNLNPVLETAWMKGRPIKSLDDARMIKVKRIPRAIKREIVPSTTYAATTSSTVQMQSTDLKASSSGSKFMSEAFAAKKAEASQNIIEKLNEIKTVLKNNPSKREMGTILEELKEFIISNYGFSRLVFDISKISRKYIQEPTKVLNDAEIQEISEALDIWQNRL